MARCTRTVVVFVGDEEKRSPVLERDASSPPACAVVVCAGDDRVRW